MAFRASKWTWKGLAARLLLVPVIAGSAPGLALAQSGPADKARSLMAQANQAMQAGDLTGAERYAKQAQMLKASLAADEPRPENILVEIQKRKAGTAGTAAAANTPAGDPKELVKMAKQALAAGQLDQAQDYASKANQAAATRGGKWGLFEDTPASVMKDVQEARAKADRVRAEQLMKDAKATYARACKTDAERMANLDQALALAYQAKNLHGPYNLWEFGDKPDKLIAECEAAKGTLRKRMPAESAVAKAPTAVPTAAKAPTLLPAAGMTKPGESPVTTAALTQPKLPAAPAMPASLPGSAVAAANPAKAAVSKLVAEGRSALGQEKVLEARAKATEARKLADEKGLSTAFSPGEDSPEMLHTACQSKGRDMIAALTRDAEKQAAAKKYAEADAALEYAQRLSDGLGLYSKPIADQRAAVAKASGKPLTAAPVATEVAITAPAAPALPPGMIVPVAAPAAPTAALPAPPAMPNATPAAPAVDLVAQAAAEMQRGDLEMARKIALKAHESPASKAQAQAMLREIDAADVAAKQKTAKAAFDNGMQSYAAGRHEAALAVFVRIDPTQLPADCKDKMEKAAADCHAKCTAAAAPAAVTPVQAQQPAGVAKVGGDAPRVQTPGEGMAEQQKAMADVAFDKLRKDGLEALNASTAAWGRGETDAALQLLAEYTAKVKASPQSPSRQALLLRPVDERAERFRLLKHHTDFVTKEAKEKTDARRELLAANVAESQKQDEVKRKVKQVNELTKAGKYKEAELAAAQAKQLDPDDPTLTAIAEQAKFRRRAEEFKTIRSDQEKFVLDGLNESERMGRPATMENPLLINPEMSRRSAVRGDDHYLRSQTPAERVIEHRLSSPYTFKFENTSLRDVIKEVRTKTGLNITTDDAAIDDEKVSLSEVMVTEEAKDLSLRDALTILLSKARLSFVVENNVVKVTSEKRSKGRMTTKVFHVMDLVTPIPEYAPAPHHRLDTAMARGNGSVLPGGGQYSMAGSGGATPIVPTGGLNGGQMVSNGQTGVSGQGGTPFLGSGGSIQNNIQSGGSPVAMSPQRAAYSEQLKKLITGMVRTGSWEALGGPGKLEYYDIGGALVVNQTADVIKEVQDLLEALRRLQDLSVAVEIRVISLSEAFFERVGVDFAMNVKTNNTTFERQLATSQFRPEPFLNDINTRGVVTGWNPAVGGFTPDLDVPIRSTSYGLSIPPFGGYQGALSPTNNGGLALGLAFLNDIQVYMFLEAAQGNRRVNVMQAPKVTLFNGQTSTVFVGDVAYFTTGLQVFNVGGQFVYLPQNIAFPVGSSSNPNPTSASTGVSVTVQAVISSDRRFVRLNLAPTLTALASATVPLFPVSTFITPVFEGGSQGQPVPFTQFFQQPSFSEITVNTTVAVPDGGTVLLGGLKTLAQARNEFGPPVISQVPYLNRLFKNVGVGQETRHVMLMVTPRIIINAEEEARQVGEGGGLLVPQN